MAADIPPTGSAPNLAIPSSAPQKPDTWIALVRKATEINSTHPYNMNREATFCLRTSKPLICSAK